MTTLVTGGAGFIGSHLCQRLLDEGHTVICIDNLLTGSKKNIDLLIPNKNFTFINHDVTQVLPKNLESRIENLDAIFHLASPASPNHNSKISYHALPFETMMVNTIATHKLLELARKHHARFLFTSSSEVYGDPLEHPQKESYLGNTSFTGPRSVYDEAKRFGETITFAHLRSYGTDIRIARIFNTYGPRMSVGDMRMVVRFISQALTGEDITIFGDGTQTRSLCYVDDTVRGLMLLIKEDKAKGKVVNIGYPDEHTVLEYANIIKKLTQSESPIIFAEPLPQNDPQRRLPDISQAKQLLDWEPQVPLEQGLKKMIEYVRKLII